LFIVFFILTFVTFLKSASMLLHHIKGLVVRDDTIIENAWLWLENDIIKDYGSMDNCPTFISNTFDASNRFVLPSWCDSHTHIVFAGSRELEFIDKIKGVPYEEIARRGGGILNSAARLANTDESELYDLANQRINEIINSGTGAVEIKSGYGLSLDAELKMLRVIRRLRENMPLPIKATFLGAHTVPTAYKSDREAYIQLIIKEMLPQIHDEQLADYIDVFCEKVAFSADETKRIIEAGAKYGLKAKIHSNQFNSMGGIEMAVAQVLNDAEIAVLQKSETIATLLPSAPFFINDPNFPPARRILDANIAVALASDYNPGSSPSGNMNFVLSLACIKLRMSPEEAINAATFNGAAAMELAHNYGSITRGKVANLIVTRPIPSLAYLPYKFGESQIEKVMLKGRFI
jgi:imidazolonepropionase